MKIRDIVVEGKVIVGPWAGSSDAVSAPIEKIARVKNPTASDWIKTPLRAFRSRRLISKYKRLANDAFEKSLEEMEKADRYEWTDPERFSHEKIYIKYLGLNRYFSMLAGDEEREFNPKAIMHYQGKYPELKQMYDADMQQEINTLTERKRKRKRKTTQTVYGGWWGGYPLDNSSGESGGEGVAEGSLEEGVNDPHIFKAIAMIGPMGAGKSTIARQLVGGSGLRSLNLDNFNELLIKQGKVVGGNLTPDQLERSWQLTQAQKSNWVDGRLGLLIDGSGRNIEGLIKPLLQLEALGYDTMVILVNVSLETSLQRQQSRAAQQAQQYGTGRNVPADLAKSSYDQIQQNIPKLQQLYGNKLLIINNEGAVDLTQEKTIVDRFLSAPPSKPAAVEWIKSHGASQGQQLDKRLAQQQRQQSSAQRAPTYTQQGVAESMLAELAPGTGGGGSNGEWFTWLAKLDKELKKVNFAPLSYRHSLQVWETIREEQIKVGIFLSSDSPFAMASVITRRSNKDFKILPNIQSILMILYTIQSLDPRRIQGVPPVYIVRDGKSMVGFFRDGDGFISINPKYSSSKTLPDGNLRIDFGRDTMTEASSAAQQAAIAINMKRAGKKPQHNK